MRASNLHKPRPLWRLNPSQTSIKPAQTSLPLASESFSYKHQTCEKLTHSCVWILLMQASNLQKTHSLLRLNPYHTSSKPAKNSLILSFESFSCLHQTCTNLTHSCVWIPLKRASNLHKPHPLLRMNLSHACKIPVQTSPTLAFESFSYKHQTCKKLTHSCVWILLMLASNLHKPHSLLRLNPSQASVKSAQTSPTPASESFSCKHLTCTNINHSCIWFLLIQASNLHKLHPLLRLNPSHAFIKSPQTSPTHASQSLSCVHQTCRNLTHTCVWILLTQASNLHKPHTLLRLNPSHTSIKPAQTSPSPASQSLPCEHQTCTNLAHSGVWILLRQASNLHKPHYLLRLNPSHTSIKPAKNSLTLAFEYFSCKHQTCKKLTHSCVWILLMLASNLHKPHPLLRLDPSHASIKPAQTSPTLASESLSCKHLTCTNLNHSASDSFSYKHQTCTNLTHSCVWILLMLSSNLRRPHPFLRLDPSHASIKPAQTSPTLASESLSCKHLTCTNLNHSASDSFSYKHQTCTNRTHSCVWILPIRAKNLHKHHTRLRLNLYHACIKLAQTSSTPASVSLSCVHQTFTILPQPASESFSYKHQTCANLNHSCVWISLMLASNLHKPHPLLRLNPSHKIIKPAQTSPTPASDSFSYKIQTCTNLTHSCVWILLMLASNMRKPQPLLCLNLSHACIKPAQTSPTPASESFSYKHQTCTNLTQSCVSILNMRASNLHKPRPLWRLNPSHTSIKPAQTSLTLASESFSYKHQTCEKFTHSCVWILLMQASNLQKKITHSCVWILLMLASNLHKPHSLLRLEPSHASIKHAQTSTTPASESFSCKHLTCTNLNHSCIWFLLIQASNLHKPHPLLRLNRTHAFIKPAQTSPFPASQSFSYKHQTCTNRTHSCVWTLPMRAKNLHKHHTRLRLNLYHACIKLAQTSSTPASESLSCVH